MINRIYNSLTEKKRHGKKSFAVLIDPDKVNDGKMQSLIDLAVTAKVERKEFKKLPVVGRFF